MDKIKYSTLNNITYCILPPSPLLPSDYQQVEYLQSSGTQFIVTSVPIASYVETRCSGKFTDSNGQWVSLVGGRNNNGSVGRYIPLGLRENQYLRVSYGDGQVSTNVNGYSANSIIFNDANHKVYINNVQVADFGSYALNTSGQQNICFFGMTGYDGSNVGYTARGQLYRASFYNNLTGDRLGNYIPCYRKSDSKPGMYDTITDTFFTNGGTGEFTVGNDV